MTASLSLPLRRLPFLSFASLRLPENTRADHRVGRINRPAIPLARVVAASSAFPPFLAPVRVPFESGSVEMMDGADLHRPPFTEVAMLTDGGVYDNLGLERVWRRCRTILVSNAGRNTPEVGSPTGKWVGQVLRTLSLVQQQAESLPQPLTSALSLMASANSTPWCRLIITPQPFTRAKARNGCGNPGHDAALHHAAT